MEKLSGTKYIPSNGTEGMIFMAEFCDKCYKRHSCTILTKSLIGQQPKQWVYDDEDKPTCTSFSAKRPKRKTRVSNNQEKLF